MTIQSNEGHVPAWTRGDRLRKARVSAGYTVKTFAQASLISEKTINDYENDRIKKVSPLRLEKWASVTGASLTWINTGERSGSPTPPEITQRRKNPDAAIAEFAARRRRERGDGDTSRYVAPSRLAA